MASFGLTRRTLSIAVSVLILAHSGCKKKCEDGSMAADCKDSGGAGSGGPGGTGGSTGVGATAKRLRASGVKDMVSHGEDAILVESYGCGRIGDSNDVLCVFSIVGSGYDWMLSLSCEFAAGDGLGYAVATDDMGREVRVTSTTLADGSSCNRTLVEDVTTEVQVRFDGVHSEAEAFSLLKLPIKVTSTQESPAKETLMFRDIAFD